MHFAPEMKIIFLVARELTVKSLIWYNSFFRKQMNKGHFILYALIIC